jgi:L-ascorbate 6-phosphate lactonase
VPTLTWLGQAGFLIESAGRRILIDPFFSEHAARTAPPLDIDVFGANIDRLLVTHEHLDHLDPQALPAIAARSPGLGVVAPIPLAGQVRDLAPGVAFTGVQPGERHSVAGAELVVVPAIHALHPADGYSDGAVDGTPARFVGYVLRLDGVTVYHAGDTIADHRLLAALEPLAIDVALLPVNGRSYFREQRDIAGNLDVRDAVALAAHIGASTLVPIHWDLFEGNLERAGAAADEAHATGAPVHVTTLARGVPWTLPPAR